MITTDTTRQANEDEVESVSLWGECGEFAVHGPMWIALLHLAETTYGWKPAGTQVPDDALFEDDEHGIPVRAVVPHYAPGSGQEMTRDDARAFTDALELLLRDLPAKGENPVPTTPGVSYRAQDHWSGPGVMSRLANYRDDIVNLVTHCRDCSPFWIW